MEIKVYWKYLDNGDLNNAYGLCYLHFHVVSGGIRNLGEVQRLWGRVIKYQVAIHPMHLGFYVAKYASKSPVFDDDVIREYYHCLVYKTQMHRYSIKKLEVCRYSDFIPMNVLRFEIRGALYRDSYLNPMSNNRYYFAFFNKGVKPPPYVKSLDDWCN
jgi:hypothetical protein